MKKVLSLLLVLAMALALCACVSSGDGEPSIIGTWSTELDFSTLLDTAAKGGAAVLPQKLLDSMKRLYGNIHFHMTLTFHENGEGILFLDAKEAMRSAIENIQKDPSLMVDYLIATFETMGKTPEDFEASTGVTVEAYVESMLDSADLEDALGGMENIEEAMTYTYENGRLSITAKEDDVTTSFTVINRGSTMTLTDYEQTGRDSADAALITEFFEDLTFTRQ